MADERLAVHDRADQGSDDAEHDGGGDEGTRLPDIGAALVQHDKPGAGQGGEERGQEQGCFDGG